MDYSCTFEAQYIMYIKFDAIRPLQSSLMCHISIQFLFENYEEMKLVLKLPHNPSFFFSSKDFAAALKRLGAQTELILFDGKTHTDLFLQVSAELDVLFYSCDGWFAYSQPNCEFLVNQNPTTTSVDEQIFCLYVF